MFVSYNIIRVQWQYTAMIGLALCGLNSTRTLVEDYLYLLPSSTGFMLISLCMNEPSNPVNCMDLEEIARIVEIQSEKVGTGE